MPAKESVLESGLMLVLASNSPRRRQLLKWAGWSFTVLPVEIDERHREGESPRGYVLRLAEGKTMAAASNAPKDLIILAADTTVVDVHLTAGGSQEYILGKPADAGEAEAMLRRLRGRTHQVYTALAALRMGDRCLVSDVCVSNVPMRDYSDEEMMAYIASGDPLDKAGAYAIQHPSFRPVDGLRGCFTNVMGLPLCLLGRILTEMGLSAERALPDACRQHPCEADCPLSAEVLGALSSG